MPKDERLYAKLALDFADHPKVLPLSDAAFRCLIEATLWSRKQMTDGFLARRYAVARWSLDVLAELSTNDTDNPSLIEREDGWLIHDFALHQDTKADIEARRQRNKDAGRLGGLAKAKRNAKRGAKRTASEVLSENVAETETETYLLTTDVVSRGAARKRATRLPTNWQPAATAIDTIRDERPDIDIDTEHKKFIDYWAAKAGRDATKVDWNATWRNWMRNARTANGTSTRTAHGTTDDKVAGWAALGTTTTTAPKGITA